MTHKSTLRAVMIQMYVIFDPTELESGRRTTLDQVKDYLDDALRVSWDEEYTDRIGMQSINCHTEELVELTTEQVTQLLEGVED